MSIKTALLGAAMLLGLVAPQANAAPVSFPAGTFYFADTPVGDTSYQLFSFQWTEQEQPVSPGFFVGTTEPGFSIEAGSLDCDFLVQSCTAMVLFQPYDIGHFESLLIFSLGGAFIDPSDWVRGVDVLLRGNGVAAVPIPAALPLLASGLGALGFIGWRRKRRASVAA